MLVLYFMYREEDDVSCTACTTHDIVHHSKHGLDLQRMLMLKCNGVSVMMEKHNKVEALADKNNVDKGWKM